MPQSNTCLTLSGGINTVPPDIYTTNLSTQLTYNINFPYLGEADVVVYREQPAGTFTLLTNSGVAGATPPNYTITGSNPSQVTFQAGEAPGGVSLIVGRRTDICQMLVEYQVGASIRAGDLNLDNTQLLYLIQELRSTLGEVINGDDSSPIIPGQDTFRISGGTGITVTEVAGPPKSQSINVDQVTIWGQNHNHSGNVSGDMSAVGDITFSAGNRSLTTGATTNDLTIAGGTGASDGALIVNRDLELATAATTQLAGRTYTWPSGETANNVLTTDGSGNLTWGDGGSASGNLWELNGTDTRLKSATDDVLFRTGNLIKIQGTDDSSTVRTINIQAPSNDANFTADWTLTLPDNEGNAGYVLSTNGSGVTNWVNPSSGTLWTRSGTTLTPTNAGDQVNIIAADDSVKIQLKADGGATFDSDIGVNFTPPANLNAATKSIFINDRAAIVGWDGSLDEATSLTNNFFFNSSGNNIFIEDGRACKLDLREGTFRFSTSTASGTAGGTASIQEKVRIDSSGRLLVGTTSTAVASTAVLEGRSGSSTDAAILRLCRGETTPADGATLGDLSFGDSNNGDAARIIAQRDGGTWTSASSRPSRLAFYTAEDTDATPTEKMRIDSSGNVGIGLTTNITSKFHVESSFAGTIAEIKNTRGSASTDAGLLVETSTTAAKTLLVKNAGTDRFWVQGNGTAYLNGSVGIGTTTPEGILNITSGSETIGSRNGVLFESSSALAADTGLPIVFTSNIGNDTNYGVASIAGRKENAISANGAGYLQFGTGASNGAISEKMRINSDGNILIPGPQTAKQLTSTNLTPRFEIRGQDWNSTTSAITRVTDDAAPPTFVLAKARGTTINSHDAVQANDVLGNLQWAYGDGVDLSNTAGRIYSLALNNATSNSLNTGLYFRTSAGAGDKLAMKMNNLGQVIVNPLNNTVGSTENTFPTNAQLHVYSALSSTPARTPAMFEDRSTGDSEMYGAVAIRRNARQEPSGNLSGAGVGVSFQLQNTDSTQFQEYAYVGGGILNNDGTPNGALLLATSKNGTRTRQVTINQNGRLFLEGTDPGIQFGTVNAAGDITSQTLDDYEEGTWTPQFFGNTNGATTQVLSGVYTKVGRLVTCEAHIRLTSKGTNTTQQLACSNLPFTCLADNYHGQVGISFFQGLIANISMLTGTVQPNSNNINFRAIEGTEATGQASLTADDANDGGSPFIVIFTAIYMTAD